VNIDPRIKVAITSFKDYVLRFFQSLNKPTADTFAWLSMVVLNCATIPSFLAVKSGLTDKMPPLDLVIILWVGLLLYFIRSAILKDMLMVVTLGIGFALQSIALGLIFFV
jgi:hypothetical protein